MDKIVRAKKEIELAIQMEKDKAKNHIESRYEEKYYKSALKAFEILCEDDENGTCMKITRGILNMLIDEKPLTPIEDTEDMWEKCEVLEGEPERYQSKRMKSLYKEIYSDGRIEYHDLAACYCVNKKNGYIFMSFLANKIHREIFPIKMPYMPKEKGDKVVCESFLTDRKYIVTDTFGILYIEKLNGEKVDVYRYFKRSDTTRTGYEEIDEKEYEKRRLLDLDQEK